MTWRSKRSTRRGVTGAVFSVHRFASCVAEVLPPTDLQSAHDNAAGSAMTVVSGAWLCSRAGSNCRITRCSRLGKGAEPCSRHGRLRRPIRCLSWSQTPPMADDTRPSPEHLCRCRCSWSGDSRAAARGANTSGTASRWWCGEDMPGEQAGGTLVSDDGERARFMWSGLQRLPVQGRL